MFFVSYKIIEVSSILICLAFCTKSIYEIYTNVVSWCANLALKGSTFSVSSLKDVI